MAFIRVENKKSVSYIRIIESYCDEQNKTKHHTLCNLGRVEYYKPEQLQRIGKVLFELGKAILMNIKTTR